MTIRKPTPLAALLLVAVAATATSVAQNTGGGFVSSFRSYRDSLFSNYDRFRTGVLSRYAAFLDSAWTEYESFTGVPIPTRPKPVVPPQAPPQYTPPPQPKPVVVEVPEAPPAPPAPPAPAPKPLTPPANALFVDFYGLRLPMPKLEASLPPNYDMSDLWNALQNSNVEAVAEALSQAAAAYSLGDWETFLLTQAYCKAALAANPNASVCLQAALMLIMGYDVSMARSGQNYLLLIAFEQAVYDHKFLQIDGERYYSYPETSGSISVPKLPQERGRKLNLVHTAGVRLPMDAQPFAFAFGGIELKGSVNRNIIRLMADYPYMDVQCHAATVFDNGLRQQLFEQLRRQVPLSQPLAAANSMLHFVQSAFRYKTDDEQFGYEKYFFFEELLYYPYSDCEDRSVFFATLVRNILGYDVLLVHLPQHQATAVAFPFEPPKRNYVLDVQNARYYICDPTYIGADVGMMHEDYFNAEMEVNAW